MKIVINALQYYPDGSGIAANLRGLFAPLTKLTDKQCQLIVSQDSPSFPCAETAEVIKAPCSSREGIKRIIYQSIVLGPKYCRDAVLLTIDSKIPLIFPAGCCLIPQITDLAMYRMPEHYQKSRVLLWKLQYRLLCRRAKHFVAISEFTKSEMVRLLRIPADRIEVIYCAARDDMRRVTDPALLEKVRAKYDLPEKYILFVGNSNPRKNLARLIRAFDRVRQEAGVQHELVIAGGQGWKFDPDEVLKDIASKDAVHFTGYVADEDLPALYSAADLFVFPTLYEGFGIPVIEAQQCGVPVLTSNVSALPEVGGDAALYVDPYDETEIAGDIETLLSDRQMREELIRKGYKNAERFSWERSAMRLNELIQKIEENF